MKPIKLDIIDDHPLVISGLKNMLEEVPEIIVIYLNRLSDYLFMLSRKIVHDTGSAEITWTPRM
jgi:cob(I)alamin adenosyltransferase